jgi:hypothetical protein
MLLLLLLLTMLLLLLADYCRPHFEKAVDGRRRVDDLFVAAAFPLRLFACVVHGQKEGYVIFLVSLSINVNGEQDKEREKMLSMVVQVSALQAFNDNGQCAM